MPTVLDLDGDGWQVREALGLTWEWAVRAAPPAAGNNAADAAAAVDRESGWLPARVPGSVLADLVRAGETPDPYVARQSRASEWVAERSWVHRRSVVLPALADRDAVLLELDGVDPSATVFWDGREVGRIEGLYRPFAVDLRSHAPDGMDPGGHVLAVVVDPAPDSEPQVGRTDRVRVHAPRMNQGWDFAPRLRHQGIWRSARIRIGPAVLVEVAARTQLDHASDSGTVHVRACVASPRAEGMRIVARVLGVEATAAVVEHGAEVSLAVPRPPRWHLRGRGSQALHVLEVVLEGGDGVVLDEWRRRVGFRELAWRPNPGSPSGALPYTAVLDGEPVALPGWNWVPADVLYGAAPPERVRHLVALAAESGARLLRVWGGGLLETEAFYDACDEAGLLVWQEFSQSSSGMQSAPTDDPAFVAALVTDAEAVVPRLARHPSLAVWTGGNELDEGGVPLTEDRSPALAALRDAVARLDPGRHWLPTSPSGPGFFYTDPDPERRHDVHGPWEHQGLTAQHALADEGSCLAHTEFGVEGMTNLRSLETVLPDPATRWPATRANPVYRHLGDWWNNAPLVQDAFGGRLERLETMQRASQWLQATGLQVLVEADRRRAPRTSIVLPWQLNESFPNAWCTAVVDHLGEPKPAYSAVARAFRPRRVVLRTATTAWDGHPELAVEAWAWSETPVPAGSTMALRLVAADGGTIGAVEGRVGAVGLPVAVLALTVPSAAVPAGAVVAWVAEWRDDGGALLDREVAVATTAADLAPLLDLAPATIEAVVDEDGAALRLRHTAGPLAVGLRLLDGRPAAAAGWAVLGNDPRPLLPGEERRLPLAWRGVEAGAPRPVVLDGWNVAPQRVAVASR